MNAVITWRSHPAAWPGVIEAYRDRMPVEPGWQIVTLR